MIATLLIVSALLVVWHLVWENMIGPTWRTSIRYRLFRLRDQIRQHIISAPKGDDVTGYQYLHDAVNGLLANIERLDFTMLWAMRSALRNDQEIRRRSMERRLVIERCEDGGEMLSTASGLFREAISANTGGWFIYIVPPLVGWMSMRGLVNLINEILGVPSRLIAESMHRPSWQFHPA
jgi:hypothetical protein